METLFSFWSVIGVCAFVFFALSLREAIFLSRMHREHPERGLYWFNVCFFLLSTTLVLLGGTYLDARRWALENIIFPYPESRYAHERNGIVHGDTWVYVSTRAQKDIYAYYLKYASEAGIATIENIENGRIALLLPSGNLYLTLVNEDDRTILYFSREGSIRIGK